MGEDCFVLGHPFLSAFNPQVDWSRGQILGPTIDILTVEYKQAQNLFRKTQLRALRTCGKRPRKGEAIYYRRVMTTKDIREWQEEQATEEGPLTKYDEVLYTERQRPLKQMRGKGNDPQTRTHEAVSCKLYPLTRKEEDHVRQFLKEEQRKGHIHPETTSIRERQIIMGCKKANTYVMKNDQAMTRRSMKVFTGKKPLLKSDEDWRHKDTPTAKRESDETATKPSSSARQLKFMNALSCLQDILRANKASNRAKDPVTTTEKSPERPKSSQQPDHRIPKDTRRQTDHPKHQTKRHKAVKVAGKQWTLESTKGGQDVPGALKHQEPCVRKPMRITEPCKKCVKKKTPCKQIQECSDALNKSTDIIQELVSAHEEPSFGPGADALPHAEGTIPSQGNKDNMKINIDHHIAKQKNEELRYKARYKKLMEAMTKPHAREWPPERSPCETIQARYRKLMEVMTKPHAREWPLERSPCETIPEMDDEALESNHRIPEWDSKAIQDATMVKGHHQDKKENKIDTEPLEGLTEETITDEAPDKQVNRQWNKCLKESWWKNAKITIIGENMWKITTEPRRKLSVAKCNILKVIKTPKENHGKAVAQEHPEKYSKEEINWNDAHHSQLIWQLAALRTNVQILLTIIIVKDPAMGHNSIAMGRDHVKAIVLLPYDAIIKALEIAALAEEQTLSFSNDSKRAIADKDTHFALSSHKGLCRQPIEGQAVPTGYQWINRQFRNSNQLMELMFAALANPRNSKGINWLLRIWRQIDKTMLMVLGKTPCEPQEEGAWYTHQTMEKNLLPGTRGRTEAPQTTTLYAQRIMKNKKKLRISQVQRTLYIKGWKEWLGRMRLSTSHPFAKPHSKEAEPFQNTEELGPMTYELNQTKKQETHDVVYATLPAIYETSLLLLQK